VEEIGSGSFGIIYSALDVKSGRMVAIKVEAVSTRSPQLYHEYQIYSRYLKAGLTGVLG
jgi:serine/threonine protein kinase